MVKLAGAHGLAKKLLTSMNLACDTRESGGYLVKGGGNGRIRTNGKQIKRK